MQYVMIATHSPEHCPTSNSKIREIMRQGAKALPGVAQKLGVQIVTLNVFGPDHVVLAVVEAKDIEAVRDFTFESGLIQWNTIKIHPTYTLEDALARSDKLQPIF
jgi:hypothetical protein